MSFDWDNYLLLAKDLAGWSVTEPIDEEAKLRAAISRAYYSAYHKVLNYLDSTGQSATLPNGNTHEKIVLCLTRSKIKDQKKLGNNLDRLKKDRHLADYNDYACNIKDQTNKALKTAERIFLQLNDQAKD